MDPNLPANLQVIGREWEARRRELADWAMERLVNRLDVWGQYTTLSAREKLTSKRSYKALTLPQKKMRGSDMVTLEKLSRHFGSLRRNHLIGLHAASTDNTSKWLAIDIDLHEIDAVDAEDNARRNLIAATSWWEALQQRGYDPLLLDSNGAGGLHLLVLFAEPAPSANVHALGQQIIADWQSQNLDEAPETFPKSPRPVEGDKLGAWLRLPGLHHTQDHITRVWSGDVWLDDPWQEGDAAIDTMLNTIPGPVPPPPPEDDGSPPPKKKRKPATRRSKSTRRRPETDKATICIDLDGVLAQYGGWAGGEVIGDPVDGAVEFTRRIAEFARIIIHTSRLRGDAPVELRVREWLDQHGFAYDSLHTGVGKPPADAYVDDRAVNCQPQEQGIVAFANAESKARQLADKKQRAGADPQFAELAEHWLTLTPDEREALLKQARGE